MAGALAVLVRQTLRGNFRRIDPASARIVLVDMANKVLPPYADDLSQAARQRLERLGVEVRLGHGVDHIDVDGVIVGGERIASRTVIWTAGVAPSPSGRWLNAPTDRAGRVRIQPDLTVPGSPEVFVLGDAASLDQDGKPLGGVAQVAMQQGRYAGRLIQSRVTGRPALPPFRYFDKGTMAVVGEGYAVLQTGRIHLKGIMAWIPWMVVHIAFLARAGLRISVMLQWAWTFLTGRRGSRLIVSAPEPPRAAATMPFATSSAARPGP
jgi:NADH:ubiquinone reductase (H+-translocating)